MTEKKYIVSAPIDKTIDDKGNLSFKFRDKVNFHPTIVINASLNLAIEAIDGSIEFELSKDNDIEHLHIAKKVLKAINDATIKIYNEESIMNEVSKILNKNK